VSCSGTHLEQLKCLAQGHIGVSQWIRTQVSHTKGLIHCTITTLAQVHSSTCASAIFSKVRF